MYRSSFPSTPYGAWRRSGALPASARLWAAWILRRAGAQLSLAARQLMLPVRRAEPVAATWPQVEFHAEAGAPEGALFVDGEYVGQIGVARL